jgi:hypothetical protein
MKNNGDFKKMFKIFVLGFVLISSIYVLYFYNNNLETFITSNNCSNCKINPSANKCEPLYDIRYSWNSRTKMVDISNIRTDYVFCEWEPNCGYTER